MRKTDTNVVYLLNLVHFVVDMEGQTKADASLASFNGVFSLEYIFPELGMLYLDKQRKVLHYSDHFGRWTKDATGFPDTNLLGREENKWLSDYVSGIKKEECFICEGILHLAKGQPPMNVTVCIIALHTRITGKISHICLVRNNEGNASRKFIERLDVESLRIIAENSLDAISLHALNGDFIYVSPSVVNLHGYTSEELAELGAYHAVYPDDLPVIRDVIEKILKNTSSVKSRYRMVHKQGHVIWVESVCQCIRNPQGEPFRISVITRDISVSRMLEESLRQNEEKYRILVKNLPAGVLLMNARGEILEVNQALLDILGSPGEESTKQINLFEFENLVEAGISGNLQKCISERKVVSGETEYSSKWGKKSYLMYSAVPVTGSDGQVHQVICTVKDISRIKRAEDKGRQQIDFLNIVINTMQEPFFVKDENHRWIMLNDAAVKMMGEPRESLLGKSDYELYPKEQADVFWANDNYVMENGSLTNEELIRWSDGTIRTIVTSKRLFNERSTGRKYIVGTIHDITDLKQTEARLRQSEYKYHELFDNASDYIFTVSLDGKFTDANQAMLKRLGVSIKEIEKFSISDFIKPEMLAESTHYHEELIRSGAISSIEIETPGKIGKPEVLEISLRLIYENDRPVGIQGIARDISIKRQASLHLEKINQELQELNVAKDKFYSIIAHDLKNPFNSLIGFSELLYDEFDELSREEMHDYVGIIRNTAKNSLILLENLLAWSRLQTGRMVYDPVRLNLANEVDATITVLYSLSYRKKIHIENNVDRSVFVTADHNMLLTILHNLLMNAIKFTPHEGSIVVRSVIVQEGSSDRVEVSVTDTGIGISMEDQTRLFSLAKPFTMPGTDKETGTGLGLLLTREMIEKHGGRLKIESIQNQGSTFSFTLTRVVP